MGKNINHLSHIKSQVVENNKPKLPTYEMLNDGELAVNYAAGYETISLRNNASGITTFSSDEYYTQQKLGSAFTGANSAVTVTDHVANSNIHMSTAEKENIDSLAGNISAISGISSADVQKWNTAVPSSRTITATSGLTGGGQLSGDVTVGLATIGTAGTYVKVSTDAYGRVSGGSNSISESDVSNLTTDLENKADKSSAITGAEYVSTAKTINFYNSNSTVVATIDATDFIKDGMVSNVAIQTISGEPYLVISFNTDSGKEDIRIRLADIFDPNSYYTKDEVYNKSEIDEMEQTLVSGITDIESRMAEKDGVEVLGARVNECITTSRTIATDSGLTGGGDLSSNRTIGLSPVGSAGTYKHVVVDQYGRVTSGSSEDANTWRPIKINGSEYLGTGTNTGAVNLVSSSTIGIADNGSDAIMFVLSDTYAKESDVEQMEETLASGITSLESKMADKAAVEVLGSRVNDLQSGKQDVIVNNKTIGFGYTTCTTDGATAAKTASLDGFVLVPYGTVSVLFTKSFTVNNPTLNISNTGAHPIYLYGFPIPLYKVNDNTVLTMVYDGAYFNVISIDSMIVQPSVEWVDLGLPSGVKWATKNIGASTPEDNGLYFSWGNVIGHAKGSGYDFGTSNDGPYAFTSGATLTGNIPVGEEYDMARANMGGNWRLPTTGEFLELYNNCSSYNWVIQNGVNGRRFVSSNNGNSIFFPAAGYYYGTTLYLEGAYGLYWSSSLYPDAAYAYYLDFGSSNVGPQDDYYRFYGFSARAVQ